MFKKQFTKAALALSIIGLALPNSTMCPVQVDGKAVAMVLLAASVPGFITGFMTNVFSKNNSQRIKNNGIALTAGTAITLALYLANYQRDRELIKGLGIFNFLTYLAGAGLGTITRLSYEGLTATQSTQSSQTILNINNKKNDTDDDALIKKALDEGL